MRQVYKNFIKTICVKLLFELYPGKIIPFPLENTSFSPSTLYQVPEELQSRPPLTSSTSPRLMLLSPHSEGQVGHTALLQPAGPVPLHALAAVPLLPSSRLPPFSLLVSA